MSNVYALVFYRKVLTCSTHVRKMALTEEVVQNFSLPSLLVGTVVLMKRSFDQSFAETMSFDYSDLGPSDVPLKILAQVSGGE